MQVCCVSSDRQQQTQVFELLMNVLHRDSKESVQPQTCDKERCIKMEKQ